ncbi:MAG: lactonase family protein [Kiritimatiellia bacterium]|nr:lactonase family protein [Kiritimatiellia bacterium]
MNRLSCSVVAAGLASGALGAPESTWVYIGTYSTRGSEGIYVARMDLETGRLDPARAVASAGSPSFLAAHPTRPILYALHDGGPTRGEIRAFSIGPETGDLTELQRESVDGPVPCHLAVDASASTLVSAIYRDGTVAVLPLDAQGGLLPRSQTLQHEGSGAHPKRQKGPHAHGVTFSPCNRYVFIPDLGIDRIVGYRFDRETGHLTAHESATAATPPGAGPRHFAFHPDGRRAYSINELDSTLTVFAWNAETGTLTPGATVSTLPPGFEGVNHPAELQIHPSGRFLYASNRGQNNIVVFDLPADGDPRPVQWIPSGGKSPRHFDLTPDSRFLLAAHQDTDDIFVFRVDPGTGRLASTEFSIRVPAPVCVLFRPAALPGASHDR